MRKSFKVKEIKEDDFITDNGRSDTVVSDMVKSIGKVLNFVSYDKIWWTCSDECSPFMGYNYHKSWLEEVEDV